MASSHLALWPPNMTANRRIWTKRGRQGVIFSGARCRRGLDLIQGFRLDPAILRRATAPGQKYLGFCASFTGFWVQDCCILWVRIYTRAHGVVVSHPLRMRKALVSIPSVSNGICPLFNGGWDVYFRWYGCYSCSFTTTWEIAGCSAQVGSVA